MKKLIALLFITLFAQSQMVFAQDGVESAVKKEYLANFVLTKNVNGFTSVETTANVNIIENKDFTSTSYIEIPYIQSYEGKDNIRYGQIKNGWDLKVLATSENDNVLLNYTFTYGVLEGLAKICNTENACIDAPTVNEVKSSQNKLLPLNKEVVLLTTNNKELDSQKKQADVVWTLTAQIMPK